MGNFCALLRPSEGFRLGDKQVLQVVKMDEKILEFRSPILVKDVLMKFTGSGIGSSKTVKQHLPLNYKLKLGKVYYILPGLEPAGAPSSQSISLAGDDTHKNGAVKRIKVVITKQELQQLLMKQISVEDVLAGLEKREGSPTVSPRNWKPGLESISEEN